MADRNVRVVSAWEGKIVRAALLAVVAEVMGGLEPAGDYVLEVSAAETWAKPGRYRGA